MTTSIASLRRELGKLSPRPRPPTWRPKPTTAETQQALNQLLTKLENLSASGAPTPKLTATEAAREREIVRELDGILGERT